MAILTFVCGACGHAFPTAHSSQVQHCVKCHRRRRGEVKRKADLEVTPDDAIRAQEIGSLFLLLHTALRLQDQAQYQPPHWESKPTAEQLAQEKEYQDETEQAAKQLESIAHQLYHQLTQGYHK